MRSNSESSDSAGSVSAGPGDVMGRMQYRERIASLARLRAAVRVLGEVDVAVWDDAELAVHLDEISATLYGIDAHLSRVAEAVRARGFDIEEPRAA